MPEISRFFGIIIKMYYADHPPKHFHAEYNEYQAMISIEELKIVEGQLPVRAHHLIIEWATLHKKELLENWDRAVSRNKLEKIKPLE
jgi:Domain of unknown function (DUF4160)